MVMATRVEYSTDAKQLLADIVQAGKVDIDLETSGLDPNRDKIGVVIARAAGHTYLLRHVPSWLNLVMEDASIEKRFFNAKFDLSFLITGCGLTDARNIRCLYVEELLVSTDRRGVKHDLQTTLDRRLGVHIDKAIDHTQINWLGELSEEMIAYALEDVQYMDTLADRLKEMVKETKQERACQIENNAVFAVAQMTVNGVPVDLDLWHESIHVWEKHRLDCFEKLNEMAPEVTKWNSPPQIKKAVRRLYEGVNLEDTTFETVNILADSGYMPLMVVLRDFKHWNKLCSSWGEEYLAKHVCPITGCIYPSWWQLNTGTGRFSCSSPNMQQLPRDTETTKFRRLIKAPPGHVVVALDYKQIEMLTAAVIAPDFELLRLFREGIDTHNYVGSLVTGKPEADINKDERQVAKSANFSLLFGGGAGGLKAYARKTYGVELTLEYCQDVIKKYFGRFQGLAKMRSWAYGQFVMPPSNMTVRNLVGARRILAGETLKPTTLLNTKVQSSAGYGIKCAMARLAHAKLVKYLRLQVHDECVFTVPIGMVDSFVEQAKDCMIKGMQEVLGPTAPVQVDVHIGPTWEEIEEPKAA